MGLFDKAKQALADMYNKKSGDITSVKQPTDNPLELQIGSNFHIKSNNSIIYKSLFRKKPEYNVVAIGKFDITNTVTVFRFYANTNTEEHTVSPATDFLQIMVSKRNGKIEECRMFSLLNEDIPTTKLAWDTWVGVQGSKIGSMDASYDDRQFTRLDAWVKSNGEWEPALEFTEFVTEGVFEQCMDIIKHEAMQYGRWLHEEHQIAEYLLLSSQDVTVSFQSQLYMTGADRVAGVATFTGIDVDVNDVIVNF